MSIPVSYLLAAAICAAKKDVRYYLNGICITDSHIVSTDGHRLFSVECETGLKSGLEIIIPNETINQFSKALSAKQKRINHFEIGKAGDYLTLCSGAFELPFKPLDGRFPQWQRTIPAKYEPSVHLSFNWGQMSDFEKMDKIIGGEKYPLVKLIPNGVSVALVELKSLPSAICIIEPMMIKE